MDMWDYEEFLRSKNIKVKGRGWVETIPDPEGIKELARDYILQKYT